MRRCCAVGGKSSRRFTLVELAIVICIALVVAAVLFPVFARPRYHHSRHSCLSNEKQIALAFLQYVDDYDEKFPPGAISRSPVAASHCPDNFPKAARSAPVVLWNEAIFPYLKTTAVYQCPDVDGPGNGEVAFSYMYSDLTSGKAYADFTAMKNTAIVTDGEVQIENIGHAWTPTIDAQPAIFGRDGRVIAGFGATVRNSATRHSGHASYLFADGHVKSLKPQEVFFQARFDMSRSHLDAHKNPIGPDPEFMTSEGRSYKATFQLR